ncbi:MAG: hypothetical protein [Microvirus sp.]|nr:MAG: hypothetical protein [Microvirus sp.]
MSKEIYIDDPLKWWNVTPHQVEQFIISENKYKISYQCPSTSTVSHQTSLLDLNS